MQIFNSKLPALSLALIILSACVREPDGSTLGIGDRIPSFSVEGPDGNFTSGNFKRKTGVLVFFASYCETCKSLMPEIQRLWEASNEGTLFEVAALSRQGVYDETEQSVAGYWEENGYTFPYYLDYNGEVYYKFAKQTIPRIYVIDTEQRITFMWVGDGSVTAEQIAREIELNISRSVDID